ncbi:hypothetical protein EB151_10695 [archaeon]|nr:hypothetical protein [archaeon]
MEKQYLDFAGKELIVDFDKLSEMVKATNPLMRDEKGNILKDDDGNIIVDDALHVDVTKYEMLRDMLSTVLQGSDEIDEKLGIMALNSLPVSFKLSYNTLIHYDILREVE